MRITPLDIRKQEFSKVMRGYDADEVKNFLEMVAAELENVIKEGQDNTEKVKSMGTQLEMYKKIEQNMQETLMTAQRLTDEIKVNAQKEADLIVKEAQVRASREVETAREKAMQFHAEMATLKHQKGMFISRFKSLVNTQIEMLNILEKDSDFGSLDRDLIDLPVNAPATRSPEAAPVRRPPPTGTQPVRKPAPTATQPIVKSE